MMTREQELYEAAQSLITALWATSVDIPMSLQKDFDRLCRAANAYSNVSESASDRLTMPECEDDGK